MAEAFQEAGFYDASYGEEGEEQAVEDQQDVQAEQGEGAEQAQAQAQAQDGQDTLEDIVEDLKRKNSTE
jgi:hypothetical protein